MQLAEMIASHPVPVVVVLVAGVIASVTDVWKFKVYNLLTFPLLLAGLLYHGITGGLAGLGDGLLGVLCGFGLMILIYSMGGMGAGDVKFVAAIGAWLGMPLTLYVFLAGSIAAGVYSVMLLIFGGQREETIGNLLILWHRLKTFGKHLGTEDRVEKEVKRTDRRRRLIPFSAMIAIGFVAVLLFSFSDQRDTVAAHESLANPFDTDRTEFP